MIRCRIKAARLFMLEHFAFSSRIYFSSSLRWITIPYFRERFLFLCLSISLSFLDIVVVFVFYNAVSGTSFEAKMHGRALPDGAAFLRLRGSGGYALCKRKRLSFHEWKDGRLTACVYTQAVLAFLVQTARREFACCASLGERLTTHKGVTARLL